MKKTLESVIRQKLKPKFHIFVDCSSTDDTKKIVENYISTNQKSKIIFINQGSKGIYNAWNKGIINLLQLVDQNHFIIILNSDDWLEDDYSIKVSKFCQYDLIAGSCMVHYKDRSFIRKCRNFKFLPILMPIMDPTLCIKASVFRKIGIYRERYLVAADHDFVFRAYEMGCEFKILNDVLVNMKMGGFSYQNKEKAFLEQLELTRERSLSPIPELAFIYRLLKIPRFRFFDFL